MVLPWLHPIQILFCSQYSAYWRWVYFRDKVQPFLILWWRSWKSYKKNSWLRRPHTPPKPLKSARLLSQSTQSQIIGSGTLVASRASFGNTSLFFQLQASMLFNFIRNATACHRHPSTDCHVKVEGTSPDWASLILFSMERGGTTHCPVPFEIWVTGHWHNGSVFSHRSRIRLF